MPTAAGTAALRDAVPRADAPVVARVIDAGALAAGKANMHELAFGCTSDNGFFGPARNPYDPSRIPGGSSGGSAVLVASGAVPAALGTDTGGSVRIPAALCGLVGFRPTHGRYPSGGVVPISPARDTVGPIARTVADVMLLDEILSGNGSALPAVDDTRGFRLAVPYSTLWEGLSPDARPVLDRALHASAAVGVGGLVPASVRNRIGGLVSCIGRFAASRVRGRRPRRSIVMTAGSFRPRRRRQQAPRGWRIPSCP
nr:amidase family protein [Burkholderia cepacia]